MTFKRLGTTGGSATQFGPQDFDKWTDYATGVLDVDTWDINSVTAYRSGKLRKRGTGSAFYYIENTGAIVADRNVTEPVLAADDTKVYQAHAQPLTNKTIVAGSNTITGIVDAMIGAHTSTKITITDRTHLPALAAYLDTIQAFTAVQKFDAAIKTKPVGTPAPDASYGQYYCNSGDANKPYFLLPNGSAINLSGTGGGTGGTPVVYDTYSATYTLTTDREA